MANITSTSFGVYLGSHYSYRDRSGSTLNNLSQETAFAWQRETRGEITETRFWLVSNIWSSFITRIPPQQVKATLTGDRLKKYDVERNKTRNKLQNSEKCRNFLIAHGIDPDQALDAVNLQRAFDGANSTISRLNAGVVPPEVDLTTKTGQAYANASISVEFTNKRGSKIQAHTAFYVGGAFNATVAGRSDVYYRESGIKASNILHEALHSLLGLHDPDLATKLGVTVTSGNTEPISQILHDNDCGG